MPVLIPIAMINHETSKTWTPERVAILALVTGAAAIGFSGILARISEAGPSATGFWRMAFVIPVFWYWVHREARKKPDRTPVLTRSDKALLVLSGLFFGLDIAFWHEALQFTTIANGTLISNLNPVLVALASVVLFGERLRGKFYLGLVLALIGAAILSGTSFEAGGDRIKGDVLSLITAVFYSAYLITVSRLRGRLGTAIVMAWSTTGAALFLLPVAWASGEVLLPGTAEGWLIVFTLSFSAQLVGQSLIAFAFAHLPAALGALGLLIQPIIAAIGAWILLGEALGAIDLLGAVVIMAGILLARLSTLPKAA